MRFPSLTISYVTSRQKPKFDWFVESLLRELKDHPGKVDVIVVDLYAEHRGSCNFPEDNWNHVEPKPCLWQGEHRLTKENWWAKASALNTALCLAKGEWFANIDDRSVLLPGWLNGIRRAMKDNYAMAGAYEKRHSMTVNGAGFIQNAGIVTGEDGREVFARQHWNSNPENCGGEWFFGCNFAVPIEWMLKVGGFPEDYTNSLSFEDVLTGLLLQNNGYPISYDRYCKMVEDRTPAEITDVIRRMDKGRSPADKSHKVLEIFKTAKDAGNSFDIRALRESVQAGNPFPIPAGPLTDWYDKQPIIEFA